MIVLAFALKGIPWAIEEVLKEDFEEEIRYYEVLIEKLREEL